MVQSLGGCFFVFLLPISLVASIMLCYYILFKMQTGARFHKQCEKDSEMARARGDQYLK